jgi:hypothetical protein
VSGTWRSNRSIEAMAVRRWVGMGWDGWPSCIPSDAIALILRDAFAQQLEAHQKIPAKIGSISLRVLVLVFVAAGQCGD